MFRGYKAWHSFVVRLKIWNGAIDTKKVFEALLIDPSKHFTVPHTSFLLLNSILMDLDFLH